MRSGSIERAKVACLERIAFFGVFELRSLRQRLTKPQVVLAKLLRGVPAAVGPLSLVARTNHAAVQLLHACGQVSFLANHDFAFKMSKRCLL